MMPARDHFQRVPLWATLAAAFAILLSGCDSGTNSSTSPGSGIVLAEVNGDPVTQGEVRAALMVKGSSLPSREDESLWRTLVENLVERRLILQRAEEIGERVDEARVQGMIQLIARQYGSPKEFKKVLLEEGIALEEWQESLRESLAIEQVMNREVYSRIKPAEKMIRDYYAKNAARFRVKKRWRIRQIVLKTEEEALKQRKRILGGVSFSIVAEENSLGPNRFKGGDMGYFSLGELPAAIESVVKELKNSDLSRAVKTSSGYHLFQVTERRSGGIRLFREVREWIRDELIAEIGRKRLKKWISMLKEKSVIRYYWRDMRHVASR